MKYLYAILPLLNGFILDLIIGDPYWLPHPVRLIGRMISGIEKPLRRIFREHLIIGGAVLSVIVMAVSTAVPMLILRTCYELNLWLGIVIESIFVFYMLAAKCLSDETMKVYKALENNDISGARKAVSMIVGRDTDRLDKCGIIRATVETSAENTSDGETAPLFYMAFGTALGVLYKSVNTMDSMLGYKNVKYIHFGRFAAKTDDVFNFIPSRLSAIFMIISAFFLGFDYKNAYRIWKRDRNSQASPNAAQTETVTAGALGIQLLGDAYYGGVLHHKNTIGDNARPIEAEDIKRTNKLMFGTSVIMLIFAVTVRIIIAFMLEEL